MGEYTFLSLGVVTFLIGWILGLWWWVWRPFIKRWKEENKDLPGLTKKPKR